MFLAVGVAGVIARMVRVTWLGIILMNARLRLVSEALMSVVIRMWMDLGPGKK